MPLLSSVTNKQISVNTVQNKNTAKEKDVGMNTADTEFPQPLYFLYFIGESTFDLRAFYLRAHFHERNTA
jgi:hypothetical protein